jgi:putative ABC transport system permease protein
LLSLALGTGANTTIFSVFTSIVLRPFPMKEPERVILLTETHQARGGTRLPTYATFLELKKQSQVVEDWVLVSWGAGPMTLSSQGKAERGFLGNVDSRIFSVLGVQPVLGRSFGNEFLGVGLGESETVVISHGLWQRFFAADPNVLGQTVNVEGFKKTVIEVMPPGF